LSSIAELSFILNKKYSFIAHCRNQNSYSQLGQMPYGVSAMPRNLSGGRAYSFDGTESLLPPAALDDPSNPMYSPYNNSQASPGGTLFTQQPSWGYGGPPDPYSQAPASPLQPRPAIGMYPGMQGGLGPGGMVGMTRGVMGSYGHGQFFPASSPGPPIQTTASNKGPDGANLFIFHIPNHFTNLDMYQLFSPYGNLLSVRIMVERDSGRSRGFGFVSYDSPEAAALAIKELNGFPVCSLLIFNIATVAVGILV
jgi:RNA recognition motif. (a.k.a. RRM, RBD, or RNP domain)